MANHQRSGYVCRSHCGMFSDAGSTPAASTIQEKDRLVHKPRPVTGRVFFFPLFLKGLGLFHIFPKHLLAPSIRPILQPFFLCLAPCSASIDRGCRVLLATCWRWTLVRDDPPHGTDQGNKPLCLRIHRQHRMVLFDCGFRIWDCGLRIVKSPQSSCCHKNPQSEISNPQLL